MISAICTAIKTWLLPARKFAKASRNRNCSTATPQWPRPLSSGELRNWGPRRGSICFPRFHSTRSVDSFVYIKSIKRFLIVNNTDDLILRARWLQLRLRPRLRSRTPSSSGTPRVQRRLNRTETQLPAETSNKQTTRWARGIPGIRLSGEKKYNKIWWNWNACAQRNRGS